MDSHQHTNLFTGQATLEATISRRRHSCAIRGMFIVSANAWDAMSHSRTMQRRGTAAAGRVGRD